MPASKRSEDHAASSEQDAPYSKKFMDLKQSKLVTIRVGKHPDEEVFAVHEDTISRSDFFRRALSGKWQESETRIINLPEDVPYVVGMYLHFIYTWRFPPMPIKDMESKQTALVDLSQVYVLAERIQDESAKNAVIRCIYEAVIPPTFSPTFSTATFVPDAAAITIIYDGTPSGCPIRRLMADIWADHDHHYKSDGVNQLPKEFLQDLVLKLQSKSLGKNKCMQSVEWYLEDNKWVPVSCVKSENA